MADSYRFQGVIVWTDAAGEVYTAPNTQVSFVDAETRAPVSIFTPGSSTSSSTVTTDDHARFEFTKPGIEPVSPVVAGVVAPVTIPAVNAHRILAEKVAGTSVDRTALDAAILEAQDAAARAEAAASAAGRSDGVLLLQGATRPVPVHLNPADPTVLPDGSLVLLDTSDVIITPTTPTTPDPDTTTPTPGTPGTASASGLPFLSGVYADTPAAAANLATLRGAPLDVLYVKPDHASWTSILADPLTRPASSIKLAVQVPLWPANGTLAAAAAGSDAASWRDLAGKLRDGDAIVLGREFTLPDVHWAATDANLQDWRTAWGKAYDAIKAAKPGVTVIWAPSIAGSKTLTNPRDAYVDGKVDVVGLTMWDWWPADTSDAAWLELKTDPLRLDDWLAFARAKGRKLALVEWALVAKGGGGADNPKYIADIYRWLYANATDVWGEIYHSTNADQRGAQLGTAGTSLATAQYKTSVQDLRGGTPPELPGVVNVTTATATHDTLTLAWNAATAPTGKTITGYQVWVGTSAPVTVTGLTYTLAGLTAATDYQVQIAAISSDYVMGPRTTVPVKTAAAPEAPAPSGQQVYLGTFDTANGWTTPTGSVSQGMLHVLPGQVSYVTLTNIAEKSVIEVSVNVLPGGTGKAVVLVNAYAGGTFLGGLAEGAGDFQSTATSKTVGWTVPAGTTSLLVGLEARNQTGTDLWVDDLKVTVVKAGQPSDPDPLPTNPTPTVPTPGPAPQGLKAGASPFEPANYRALWGNSQFCAPCKGWPAYNSGDPYSAGREVRKMIGYANSGINATAWNIPTWLVDTRLPPGPVEQGGGGYVRRDIHQFLPPDRPWREDRWGNNYESFMRNAPFPIGFRPAAYTGQWGDKSAEWIDIGTMIHYGGWVWEFRDGEWKFLNAARSDNVHLNYGAFDKGSVVASGLLGAPMHLGIAECKAFRDAGTHVKHALGIEFPKCDGAWNRPSWPAKTSDANNPDNVGLFQASRLILDPNFNVAGSGLSWWAKMLCYVLQEYGMIITDTSGSVMIRGEEYLGTGTNPWPSMWGDLRDIPWERVYVSQKDYRGIPS